MLPSCAQPQIADIGFRGDIAHIDEHIEEAVDIGLGGSLGPDAAFIDWVTGALPVDRVPDALLRVVTRYSEERRPGEPFRHWARRTDADDLRSTLTGVAEPVTS
jgi:ferredoxin-nitrite reductase